jgi:hypothetical protein
MRHLVRRPEGAEITARSRPVDDVQCAQEDAWRWASSWRLGAAVDIVTHFRTRGMCRRIGQTLRRGHPPQIESFYCQRPVFRPALSAPPRTRYPIHCRFRTLSGHHLIRAFPNFPAQAHVGEISSVREQAKFHGSINSIRWACVPKGWRAQSRHPTHLLSMDAGSDDSFSPSGHAWSGTTAFGDKARQSNACIDADPFVAVDYQSVRCVHPHRCFTMNQLRVLWTLDACAGIAAFGRPELVNLSASDPLLRYCSHAPVVRWSTGSRWIISVDDQAYEKSRNVIDMAHDVAITAMCRGIHFVIMTPRHLALMSTNGLEREPVEHLRRGGSTVFTSSQRAEHALMTAWSEAPTTKMGRALGLPWAHDLDLSACTV